MLELSTSPSSTVVAVTVRQNRLTMASRAAVEEAKAFDGLGGRSQEESDGRPQPRQGVVGGATDFR